MHFVQVPVTLLEYSMNAVTQGIDAIASTRVLIRGENGHTSTHAVTGETIHRTFRYEMYQPCCLHLFFFR